MYMQYIRVFSPFLTCTIVLLVGIWIRECHPHMTAGNLIYLPSDRRHVRAKSHSQSIITSDGIFSLPFVISSSYQLQQPNYMRGRKHFLATRYRQACFELPPPDGHKINHKQLHPFCLAILIYLV